MRLFEENPDRLLDAAANGISVADVSGDGNPDIEVANGHVGVLLGKRGRCLPGGTDLQIGWI